MVREYVATRRREIRVEVGQEPANAFIPQEPRAARPRVDFGDVAIRLRGELVTCALFSLRLLLGQGRAQGQCLGWAGSLLRGHVHAFNVLGGVPTGKIRYDNLKAAVASVIGFSRQPGRGRQVDRRPFPLRHRSFYCQPRNPRCAREGRRPRGRSAGSDATTSSPSRSRLPRRAQRYGRRLGRSRRRPTDPVPRPHGRGNTLPPSSHPRAPSDEPFARPAAGSPRAWTSTPRSRSG